MAATLCHGQHLLEEHSFIVPGKVFTQGVVENALPTYPGEAMAKALNAEARDHTPEQWVAMLGLMDLRGGGRTSEVLRSWYAQRGVMLGANPGKGIGWDKRLHPLPPSIGLEQRFHTYCSSTSELHPQHLFSCLETGSH